jgi:hypothetical protein
MSDENPDYYKVGGIEAWDFIVAKLTPRELVGYIKGCLLHYEARMEHKYGGAESYKDAKKIKWYADKLPEALERALKAEHPPEVPVAPEPLVVDPRAFDPAE